jgi:hypothetical protein
MRGVASGDAAHKLTTPLTPTLSPPRRGEGASRVAEEERFGFATGG